MSKAGHPLKFKSPEELQEKIDQYFKECKDIGEIPTVTGLAYQLDTTRRTLLLYENSEENDWLNRLDEDTRSKYNRIIKRAKQYIESRYEQSLFQQGKTTGAIFSLKNNYGWVDKQEITNSTSTNKYDHLTEEEIRKRIEELL